jgi:predicted nucleotidyltransferase
MNNLKYNINKELIGYASAFVSFVIPKLDFVNEIILFGSAARGESDKSSDIDLFFNLEKNQNEKEIKEIIDEELKKFYKSKIAEVWFLKGIKNQINVNVGWLDEWKLKRSLISDGICLYGKYKEIPENMKDFVLFNIEPIKNVAKRNKVIREIFGRQEKGYLKKGILAEFGGKRVSSSSFIMPKEHANKIILFLKKEKVNCWFFELWTDELSVGEGLGEERK